MSAPETLRVLDPRAFPDARAAAAPRLGTVHGATVGLLWNNRPRGDLILQGVAARLERDHGARTLFTNKLRVGMGATEDEIRRLEKEVEAVIVGVGD